jgi:hypothetical protein
MPKYYIRDGAERRVVDAPTPEDAICICIMHFFSTFIVNGFYSVSEVGFDQHDDDIVFDSNFILDLISQKKREKDQDDP